MAGIILNYFGIILFHMALHVDMLCVVCVSRLTDVVLLYTEVYVGG